MLSASRAFGLALALLVLPLPACANEQETYCDSVQAHQQELTDIAARGGAAALFDAADVYRELAEDAPDDIRDEWSTVLGAIERLRTALDDLGIDPSAYDPETPPTGLSGADRARLQAAADGLVAPDVTAAMDAVEQQARDVCHTPLSM